MAPNCSRALCATARPLRPRPDDPNDGRERHPARATGAGSGRDGTRGAGIVTAIDVLAGLGWLPASSEQAWRQGRIPYLERAVTANLNKVSKAMRYFRRWAMARGLRPSENAYVARSRRRQPL